MLVKLKWVEGVGATGGFIPDTPNDMDPIVPLKYTPLGRPLHGRHNLAFRIA